MKYKVTSRSVRFLGNDNPRGDHEVHDLKNEKSQCQIDEIFRAGHGVGFIPDTLEEAKSNKFDSCAYCIGGGSR